MPEIRRSVVVGHTADNLFTLVSGVRKYPEFIKWIKALRVSDERLEGTAACCVGDVVVGFKGFTERFSSKVRADSVTRTVTADLVRGPFRRLHNSWLITPRAEKQAAVDFFIDFEFDSVVLRTLAATNSSLAVSRIIDAYVTEADRRFGPAEPVD